ncbi:MAG: dihydroorotate dehydrogenase electron transfer subunit [Erysipelotrichaceae bacterium]|nr:dihydroorotate dehydrogenase electron transfer subunit [Erysipelotrichaceae bacterium]
MLRAQKLTIKENTQLNENTFKLVLQGDVPQDLKPGQFAEVKVPGFSLGRPLSLNDFDQESVTFVYRIAGKGTKELTTLKEGELDVINGCGNGFTLKENEHVLVVGGGIGTAPLLPLIRALKEKNCKVDVIFGFRERKETLFEEELKALGADFWFTYDSEGNNVVTKMLELGKEDLYFYACGPLPMMAALTNASKASGQCSLETRMGCGFGACMGCSLQLKERTARICKEGPVFAKEEIVWQNLK